MCVVLPPSSKNVKQSMPILSKKLHSWLVNFEPNISRIYTPQLKSWVSLLHSMPMKMERIESSKTSALKAQMPGDYPKNTIRHSTHGESLKSRYISLFKILHNLTNFSWKPDLCISLNISFLHTVLYAAWKSINRWCTSTFCSQHFSNICL